MGISIVAIDNRDLSRRHVGLDGRRASVMDDQLDVPLEDGELLAEVELTTDLIIAASEADHALSQAVVDAILGVESGSRQDAADPVSGFIPAQTVRHSA
jgi:hypothetical protein